MPYYIFALAESLDFHSFGHMLWVLGMFWGEGFFGGWFFLVYFVGFSQGEGAKVENWLLCAVARHLAVEVF